jgi:hypothetical protein
MVVGFTTTYSISAKQKSPNRRLLSPMSERGEPSLHYVFPLIFQVFYAESTFRISVLNYLNIYIQEKLVDTKEVSILS